MRVPAPSSSLLRGPPGVSRHSVPVPLRWPNAGTGPPSPWFPSRNPASWCLTLPSREWTPVVPEPSHTHGSGAGNPRAAGHRHATHRSGALPSSLPPSPRRRMGGEGCLRRLSSWTRRTLAIGAERIRWHIALGSFGRWLSIGITADPLGSRRAGHLQEEPLRSLSRNRQRGQTRQRQRNHPAAHSG